MGSISWNSQALWSAFGFSERRLLSPQRDCHGDGVGDLQSFQWGTTVSIKVGWLSTGLLRQQRQGEGTE